MSAKRFHWLEIAGGLVGVLIVSSIKQPTPLLLSIVGFFSVRLLSERLETPVCDSAELLIECVSVSSEPRGDFFAKVFTAVEVVGPSCAVAISCEL